MSLSAFTWPPDLLLHPHPTPTFTNNCFAKPSTVLKGRASVNILNDQYDLLRQEHQTGFREVIGMTTSDFRRWLFLGNSGWGDNTLHGTFASRLPGKQKSIPTVARIPSGIMN